MENIYSHEMPGKTVTMGKSNMGKPIYQFKFSSFMRGPPRKMTSALILVKLKFL